MASVPDLVPVLRGDLGWNAVDGSANWAPIAGHGTLVAGAAAAATNNGAGVSGVAWGAQIIPVRISNLSDGSAYVSDAAKCINYAADKGARVINVSYDVAGSASIDAAGKYAQSKGAVTAVAAGNAGIDPGWASYTGFLAVSATNSSEVVASFSNFGAFVDIAAPGVNIMTTRRDGTYGVSSGTSLSSPVAAGVLALIFGANPGLSATQAQSILLASADDLGASGTDKYYGAGRVNAARAIASAKGGSLPAPSPTLTPSATPTKATTPVATATPYPTATPKPGDSVPPSVSISSPTASVTVSGSITINAQASDNIGVSRVEFYVDGVLLRSDTSAPYSVSWNTRKSSKGSHTLTAVAYDGAGNSASDSTVVTVR